MSYSKVKIWIHSILGVKNRENLITIDIEKQIHEQIKKQKQHHKKITFNEEYERFIKLYGV